jgi:hypothetical protein
MTMNITTDPSIWLYAITVLGIWSFFIKETPFYHFGENCFVATSMGIAVQKALSNIEVVGFGQITAGSVWIIIPVILGLLQFARLSRPYGFLSRYPTSIITAVGTGLMVRTTLESDLINQIINTLVPLGDPLTSFNAIFGVAVVCAVLWYFIFTRPPKYEAENWIRFVARQMVMVVFGVSLAQSAISQSSAMFSALRAILVTWLGL